MWKVAVQIKAQSYENEAKHAGKNICSIFKKGITKV